MGKLLAIAGVTVAVVYGVFELLEGVGTVAEVLTCHPAVTAAAASLLALWAIVRVSVWLERR